VLGLRWQKHCCSVMLLRHMYTALVGGHHVPGCMMQPCQVTHQLQALTVDGRCALSISSPCVTGAQKSTTVTHGVPLKPKHRRIQNHRIEFIVAGVTTMRNYKHIHCASKHPSLV
jgi:hypothetical protein